MNLAIPKGGGNYHLLTNDGLEIGDKVFPLIHGYRAAGVFYVTELDLEFTDADYMLACTGWPSEPHTILRFYTENGLLHIHTDKGYSPAAVYFKRI